MGREQRGHSWSPGCEGGLQGRQRLEHSQPCKELGLNLGAVGSHRRICIRGESWVSILERPLVAVFEEMESWSELGQGRPVRKL